MLWVVVFLVALAALVGLWATIAVRAQRANNVMGRRRAKLIGDDERVDSANREIPRH